MGSAVTILLLWLLPLSRGGLVALLALVVVAGTWAAGRAERLLGKKDPGAIVVDEMMGQIVSVLPFALTPATLLAGFVLFRVFDVVKPPPARGSQRIPGGVGVVVDDLIAGVYAAAVLGVLHAVLGWP